MGSSGINAVSSRLFAATLLPQAHKRDASLVMSTVCRQVRVLADECWRSRLVRCCVCEARVSWREVRKDGLICKVGATITVDFANETDACAFTDFVGMDRENLKVMLNKAPMAAAVLEESNANGQPAPSTPPAHGPAPTTPPARGCSTKAVFGETPERLNNPNKRARVLDVSDVATDLKKI